MIRSLTVNGSMKNVKELWIKFDNLLSPSFLFFLIKSKLKFT